MNPGQNFGGARAFLPKVKPVKNYFEVRTRASHAPHPHGPPMDNEVGKVDKALVTITVLKKERLRCSI